MAANPCVQCRVTPQTKIQLRVLAQERQLTESALLKKLVETALLQTAGMATLAVSKPIEPVSRGARLYVRLRPEDHVLLRERACGRGMAAATYGSFLLRAHLRAVAPIPDRELAELKRSVAELGAIGRNLNQIARVANQTGRVNGPTGQDLRALLRACEALRDHVKGFIRANGASWESGYAEACR
jgi:mobilization protein MobC